MDLKTYILVITMWGHNGDEWEYIGNQSRLLQHMTEDQCIFLADMWDESYENKYYKLEYHCFPSDCAGKESCD
jgi:hypothetical protein